MQDLVVVTLYFLFSRKHTSRPRCFRPSTVFLSRCFNLLPVRPKSLPRYKEHVTYNKLNRSCLNGLIRKLHAEYFLTAYEQCVLDAINHVSAL